MGIKAVRPSKRGIGEQCVAKLAQAAMPMHARRGRTNFSASMEVEGQVEHELSRHSYSINLFCAL